MAAPNKAGPPIVIATKYVIGRCIPTAKRNAAKIRVTQFVMNTWLKKV